MPDRVIAPLRELRQPLHEGVRQLQVAAGAVSNAEPKVALAALEEANRYLEETFLPLSEAEELTMFPAVDGCLGITGATDAMRSQHARLAAMAKDLSNVVTAAQKDGDAAAYARYLLPLLHGLYGAIRVHIESEDEAYLSLLDAHLSESQVGVVVENLRRIATQNGQPPER